MSKSPISFRVKGKPLIGLRILVTRASHQALGLTDPLTQLGAQVIEIPMIEIRSPENGYGALDYALMKIDHYDTLILTSVNGAEVFLERYNSTCLPMPGM